MEKSKHTWPEGNDRVPYWIYTDQANYERELEKIFYGPFWNYVGLECEVPRAGDFKGTQIGDQSIIVVRDQNDEVNVFVNRCAHRGVKICEQDKGSFKEIICPYHQWTYDLDGRLLGVPFHRGVKGKGGMPDNFSFEANGLDKLRVHIRNGGIFATMSDATPSFEDYMGPRILGYYDRQLDGRVLKLLGHSRQRIGANWKLMLENIKDTHHASLLHVFFVTFGLFRVDNESRVEMDKTGLHTALSSIRGEQELNDGTMGRDFWIYGLMMEKVYEKMYNLADIFLLYLQGTLNNSSNLCKYEQPSFQGNPKVQILAFVLEKNSSILFLPHDETKLSFLISETFP